MAKYNSKQFKELYDNFMSMFNNEGYTVYESIKESIEQDYEHSSINSNLSKHVIISVLNDVIVDYIIMHEKVLDEQEFLKELEKDGNIQLL